MDQTPPKEKKVRKNKKTNLAIRNERGLLKEIDYIFNEDGTINWRKMVKPSSLYPNQFKTSEADISKLKDEDLLIDLKGLRDLALLRGYTNVSHSVISCSQEFVCVLCKIEWIANFETNNLPVSFTAIADASLKNTSGFAVNFLGAIAENRAFARAVRNFLNINIVSREEIKQDKYLDVPGQTTQEIGLDPLSTLKEIMAEKKITWETIKKQLIEFGISEIGDCDSVDKLKIPIVLELLGHIKES